MRDLANPAGRVAYEVVIPGRVPLLTPDRVLHRGVADEASSVLRQIGVGDGDHAFTVIFPEALSEAEAARVIVRTSVGRHVLPLAPEPVTVFEPIAYVAMDIVDNCNLRCPFCVVDYAEVRRTHVMDERVFDSALRLLPYTGPANFWLSCLHEPTLHPRLEAFIARIPAVYRNKVFYTTNLARRMPDSYFAALANSGLHHLNISIESQDPAIYERMRKGARWRIFAENWEKLLAAFATGPNAPRLRYNVMAYRSNLAEIPDLVETLLADRRAWQVEVRYTFDRHHIPDAFRNAEYLAAEDWTWLADRLARHDTARVLLIPPPGGQGHVPGSTAPPAETARDNMAPPGGPWNRPARPFQISLGWDGAMRVQGPNPHSGDLRGDVITYVTTNIQFLKDPVDFLLSL